MNTLGNSNLLNTMQSAFDPASNAGQGLNNASGLSNNKGLEKTGSFETQGIEGITEGVNGVSSPEKTLEDFANVFKNSLSEVNAMSQKADQLATDYALGKDVPLHQVMIAGEKANLSMELTTQVRNKLIQAYQDIMHMPL